MGLHGKHILIDGLNLALRHGTGIKTYGQLMLQALHGLGARVSVLWGCRRGRGPQVQEDPLSTCGGRRGSRWRRAVNALRSLPGCFRKLRGHAPGGGLFPADPEDLVARLAHRYYFLPGCYELANQLFRHTGAVLGARLGEPLDLWHATYPLPLRVQKAQTVTTVHDVIPLRLPWATRDDKQLFRRAVRQALDHSDLVVTDSESARRDILDIYRPAPERVEVLHPAVAKASAPPPADVLARQLGVYGLEPQSYLLFVGTVEPRKNLGRLCQALARLDRGPPLVVVGPLGWRWEEELRPAEPLAARKKIMVLGHVPREHLEFLYAEALLLAFPSLYEGFGLPPLEAMARGCPVLASDATSLPEVCGEAALYADPYDVGDLAEKLDALIRDDGLRARLRERGKERAERYSTENHRRRLLELYGRVLS